MKQGTVSYDVTFNRKSGKVGDMPLELYRREVAIAVAYYEENDLDGDDFSTDDIDKGLVARLGEECRRAMVRDPTLTRYSARAVQNLSIKEPEMDEDSEVEGAEAGAAQ